MDLQNNGIKHEKEFLPNQHVLIELLTTDENGSIPLLNFLDNTQYYLEKIDKLEIRVQELEKQTNQTPENNMNLHMRKINTYFLPKKTEITEKISVQNEMSKEDFENMENIDNRMMTNLEHMENLVRVAKNLLTRK